MSQPSPGRTVAWITRATSRYKALGSALQFNDQNRPRLELAAEHQANAARGQVQHPPVPPHVRTTDTCCCAGAAPF